MNNPSYNNLGGSGSRASPTFSTGPGALFSSYTSGPPYTVTYSWSSCPLVAGDIGNRLVTLTSASVTAVCAITARTSSSVTLNQTSAWFQAGSTLPQSGNVTLTTGGPFLITPSASGGLLNADVGYLLDGTLGNNNYFVGGAISGSTYIEFDFGISCSLPMQKIITEFTFYQSGGSGSLYQQGTWKFQASNNNSTWVDLTSAFILGVSDGGATGVATAVRACAPSGGWTTGYRYYRLVGVSGSTNAGPYVMGINFKIDDYVNNSAADSTPMPTVADSNLRLALSQLYRVSASPTSPDLPTGIVYADDFSHIQNVTTADGWSAYPSYGTASADYQNVRVGTVSLQMASNASGGAYAQRTFNTPLNLSNTSAVLNLAVVSCPSDGAQNIIAKIYMLDINGNSYSDQFKNVILEAAGATPSWNGWLPRLAMNLNTGTYKTATLGGSFDLTKVNFLEIQLSEFASHAYTVTFDSLVFVQHPSSPQFMFRSDASSGISTLMLMDYCTANWPKVKITAGINPGYLSGTDSTTNVGPTNTGYGLLSSAYSSAIANGHRVMNYCDQFGSRPSDIDAPLSASSRVGQAIWNRYYMEGWGYPSQDIRVLAPGSVNYWSPLLAALISQYMDSHTTALDEVGNDTQFTGELVPTGTPIDTLSITGVLATDVSLATIQGMLNTCQANGRYCAFGHTQDNGATSGWGTGGASGGIVSGDRPNLQAAINFIKYYLGPATNGTIMGGASGYTPPVAGICITAGQLNNIQPPAPTLPTQAQVLYNTSFGAAGALTTGTLTLPNSGSAPYTPNSALVVPSGFYGTIGSLTQGTYSSSSGPSWIDVTLPNVAANVVAITLTPLAGTTPTNLTAITVDAYRNGSDQSLSQVTIGNNGWTLTPSLPSTANTYVLTVQYPAYASGDTFDINVVATLNGGSTVPRRYHTGSGGSIGSGNTPINVVVSSPVISNLDLGITPGDAYDSTTNQPITFTDGGTWPVLSGAEIRCFVASLADLQTRIFNTICSVAGSPQVISVPFTPSQTSLLVPGQIYAYDVCAKLATNEIRTLLNGQITALPSITPTW